MLKIGSKPSFRATMALITILLVFAPKLGAQSGLITGQVVDKETGVPLADVNITVIDSKIGAVTNQEGRYELWLPVGDHTLLFSHIAYGKWRAQVAIKPRIQPIILDVQLEPSVLPLPTVDITAEHSGQTISEYAPKAAAVRSMASPLPEVLLSLQTLPGVSSPNDQSTLYNVRGGNFDENSIYINGVEIYQPQLVRKGIAENPSLVNSHLLETINFRTGVFPVSYGDKLSSVLDLKYRQQFESTVFTKADIGAVGLNAAVGVRLMRNVWLQLAMRRIRYGYILENSDDLQGEYTPLFQDFQGLLHFRPTDGIGISLLGLQASSRFAAQPDNLSHLGLFGEVFTISFGGSEEFSYKTKLLSLKVDYQPWRDLALSWTNSYFGQEEEEDTNVGSAIQHISLNREESAFQREEISNWYHGKFYTSKVGLQWLLSSSVLLNAGLELKYFSIDDSLFSVWMQESDLGAFYLNTEENGRRGLTHRDGFILGRFIQSNVELSNKLSLQIGLRWTKSSLNREQLLLPRARLMYRLTDVSKLIVAAGYYAQPPIYKEFQFRTEEDDAGLQAQKARQFTVGFQRFLRDKLSLKIEAYYKRYSDLISYDLKDVRITYSGENDAKGYAFGLDAHLHGDILPGTENWISYSFLVAREDLLHDGQGYAPRASDRRHQIAVYNEDRMERLPWSKLFLRFVFGTGYPYTPSHWVYNSERDAYELREKKRNSARLPFYARIDLGFMQEIKLGQNRRIVLREEILNAPDKKNTLGYSLVFDRAFKQRLGGRVYNFGVLVEL